MEIKTDLVVLANIPARNRKAKQYSLSVSETETENVTELINSQSIANFGLAMVIFVFCLQLAMHIF